MNILEQIKQDLISAMKSKDTEKVATLRMLQAAIKNKEIDMNRQEMSEEVILEVISKQAKQRKEAIAEYEKGGRTELAEKEKQELDILEKYLPAQISDDEIITVVKTIIADLHAEKSDFGKVMGMAAKQLKGKADGGRIRGIVEGLL
ncbi:GatB/YqeY domain-containing protein [bacterium]|nr:MAG: GatB/YqeY domain-containing protein [bacterium]